jgi:hypothetical protein
MILHINIFFQFIFSLIYKLPKRIMHLHNLYTDIAKITQRSYKEKGGNLKPLLGSI